MQRTGKISYVSKGLAYANGERVFNPVPRCVKPDFDSVKPWMIFEPEEFLIKLINVNSRVNPFFWMNLLKR